MKEVFNGFKNYLKQISKYPLLDGTQEIELANRIADGDEEARQELINSNLRLVVFVAKRYKDVSTMPLEDLVADGNIGLMVAVDKFKPEMNCRFSTCAIPWIRQEITKSLTRNSKTIRLPADVYQKLSQLGKVYDKFAADGNHNPSDEQLAEALGITREKVIMLKQYKLTTLSLEMPLNDENEDTIADLQYDPDGETPETYASRNFLKEEIAAKLAELPERTRKMIEMRYGLGEGQTEATLEEVGEAFGLTRERVRQIVKDGLQALRNEWDN